MKKNLFAATALLALCCAPLSAQQSYTVQGTVSDATVNGKKIYIYRYDDNVRVDSTTVEGGKFLFKGQTNEPAFCRVNLTQQLYANCILEGGAISVNLEKPNQPSGTPLNEALAVIGAKEESISALLKAKREELSKQTTNAEEMSKLWGEFFNTTVTPEISKVTAEYFGQHNNDAVGEYLVRSNFCPKNDLKVWEPMLENFGPWLKSRKTVQQMVEQVANIKNSAEGKMFTNFVGKGVDGKEASLSDYVGKGTYVLVDFWASWCGPCKAEIPNLAKLHNQYKDKGFTVLGLFVWDKEPNLKKALEAEGINWPQIIDSNNTVTGLYGVSGIPQIILFGPDGTILKRGLRGAEMIATVDEYMKVK